MLSRYGRLRLAWRVLRGEVFPHPYFLPVVEIQDGCIIETRHHGWLHVKVRGR